MSKTFYKYKPRDPQDSQIDWASITKNISDGLMAERDRRVQEKETIEQQHQDAMSKMSDYEVGLNQDANEWVMRQSQNHKRFLLEQNRMMKAGLLSPGDYKIRRQKLADTWSNVNAAMKMFNEGFKAAIDSGTDGSLFLAEEAASILDFKNRELYINPKTGESYFASFDEKGKVIPETLKPVRSMLNNLNWQWEGFDPSEINDNLKGIAEWKLALKNGWFNVTDARQNPEYNNWLEGTVSGIMGSDRKVASILTEGLQGYSFTRDKSKSGGNVILIEDDADGVAQPQLTAEQRKKAEDYVKSQIEMRIGRTEDRKTHTPTAKETDRRLGKELQEKTFDRIDKALQGDKSAMDSMFRELGIDYRVEDGQLIISDDNGERRPINLDQGHKEIGVQLVSELGMDGEAYSRREIEYELPNPSVNKYGQFTRPKRSDGGLSEHITSKDYSSFDESYDGARVSKIKEILYRAGISGVDISYDEEREMMSVNGQEIGNVNDMSLGDVMSTIESMTSQDSGGSGAYDEL